MKTKIIGTQEKIFHGMTAYALCLVMKEAVRRGIEEIRTHLSDFKVSEKDSDTKKIDYVTDADTAAQKAMVKVLKRSFPEAGLLFEEDLQRESSHNLQDLTFVGDPLDGTKQYVRKGSDGLGCMLAAVCDGQIISCCVGDVMTQDMYYYHIGNEKVHRHHKYRNYRLGYRSKDEKYIYLFDDIRTLPSWVDSISTPEEGYFSGFIKASGSVGTNMARLWKNEVAGVFLETQKATLWDILPVLGITEQLGYVFLLYEDGKFVPWDRPTPLEIMHQPSSLILHESEVEKFCSWFQRQN